MLMARSVLKAIALSSVSMIGILPAQAQDQAAPTPAESSPSQTGDTSDAQLEEIVVTARKRAENLQETPIAITAFTASTIEKLSAAGINDIGKFAPNVLGTSGQASGSDSNFFIRGVGQADW